jgi:hypothetical protein
MNAQNYCLVVGIVIAVTLENVPAKPHASNGFASAPFSPKSEITRNHHSESWHAGDSLDLVQVRS